MTVISLLQPWAQLVVLGAKKIETRSWNTAFRGELLIHASLGKHYGSGKDKISCRELCYRTQFSDFIDGGNGFDKLPFGAIIGKVNMVGTFPTEMCQMPMGLELRKWWNSGNLVDWTEQEEAFGDFSHNRFGWILNDAVKFDKPIPAKGRQGFWNYEFTQ